MYVRDVPRIGTRFAVHRRMPIVIVRRADVVIVVVRILGVMMVGFIQPRGYQSMIVPSMHINIRVIEMNVRMRHRHGRQRQIETSK